MIHEGVKAERTFKKTGYGQPCANPLTAQMIANNGRLGDGTSANMYVDKALIPIENTSVLLTPILSPSRPPTNAPMLYDARNAVSMNERPGDDISRLAARFAFATAKGLRQR